MPLTQQRLDKVRCERLRPVQLAVDADDQFEAHGWRLVCASARLGL